MSFPKRGDIWLVSLEPVLGHEIGKTRPALIISNDQNNQYSGTLTVLPITSKTKEVYPFETLIAKCQTGLSTDSKVKCNQIRTVSKQRLVRFLGNLSSETMKKVEDSLLIHLGITLNS